MIEYINATNIFLSMQFLGFLKPRMLKFRENQMREIQEVPVFTFFNNLIEWQTDTPLTILRDEISVYH